MLIEILFFAFANFQVITCPMPENVNYSDYNEEHIATKYLNSEEKINSINDLTKNSTFNESSTPTLTDYDISIIQYRKLFQHRRNDIMEAIKTIKNVEKLEKQFKMVELLLSKLFKVLEESRITLMQHGFIAGDSFPEDQRILEAFSLIIENTYFLGCLALHMPDATESVFSRPANQQPWRVLTKFAIGYADDSGVFRGYDDNIIPLMSQELNIIERNVDYINPYSKMDRLKKLSQEFASNSNKEPKKRTPEKKEKKAKGPKLSGPRHREL